MNYFKAIARRANELNALGQEYLDTLPFMSNTDVCNRLLAAARLLYAANPAEIPDWAEWLLFDGCVPFGSSKSGSIYNLLGTAIVAQDARRRNLLEVVEGRTEHYLDLATVAEEDVVKRYESSEQQELLHG